MRFLITGIGGFAGAHLASLLLERGHQVFGIVRRPDPNANIRNLQQRFPRFRPEALYACDVRERGGVGEAVRCARPDGIFHLAAQSSVGSGEDEAAATFSVNTIGTLQVLAAARAEGRGCRVAVISSGETYGWSATSAAIGEGARLRPATIYGVSKAASELLARQAVEGYGADVIIVRPFNHTGPGQSPRFVCADFSRQIVEIERGKQKAIAVGNVDVVRDFLDARDVVRAYVGLWERGERGEAYNVASGVGRRIGSILDDLCAQARVPVRIEVDPERLRHVDIPVLVGDSARAREAGWQPVFSWEQTVEDLLDDWRRRLAATPG